MTTATMPKHLSAWTPGLRLDPDFPTTPGGHASGAAPGTWPTGIGAWRGHLPRPVLARWSARGRRGLSWIRRAAVRAMAFGTVVAVLVAAVAVVNWWTQPRRPYAFYRTDSPLRLSGFGSGLTETFPLEGGNLQVAWSAFTEWGCRLRVDLIPAGGGAPVRLADAPIATAATGSAALRGVAPGAYALRADSACAWTVAFGPEPRND